MNREILVSAVLRAESRREGAIDIDIVRRALAAQPAPVPVAWLKTMYSGTRPMLEVDHLRKDTSIPVYTHPVVPVPDENPNHQGQACPAHVLLRSCARTVCA